MDLNNIKIHFDVKANEDAVRNQFTGTYKIHRLWSLFVAEVKCNWYLLWASIARGECMFVGYNSSWKRCIVGTVTGSMWNNTLTLNRIFWCEGK